MQPSAKTAVSKAAGYATFSNFGMKIFVLGSGKGKGLAVDNKTKKQVFMDMFELQTGLGMGVKKFILVWIFETPKALSQFINSGWELGAQTSVAAKSGDKGGSIQGALPIAPGVWLYQLTEAGLALELTAKGTKYYKDDDLNVSRYRAQGGGTGLADAGAANPVRLPTRQHPGGGASPT